MDEQALIVQGTPSAGDAFLAVIERVASNPQVNIETMRAMLDMKITVMKMEAESAFSRDMKAAQEEMRPVVRDAENQHTRSRYARLETIDENIRPIYTRHGFSLSFNSGEPRNKGSVRMLCDVLHEAGHTKHYELEGDLDIAGSQGKSNKTSIQGLGSAVSYLRRYLTCMIFNITLTNEDNDGNRGSAEAAQRVAEQKIAGTWTPPVEDYGPPPELPPEAVTDHSAATRRAASKFDVLKAFRQLKDRYQKIGKIPAYYAVLGRFGQEKSSGFPQTEQGLRDARACFKEMQLNVADLEAWAAQHPAPSAAELAKFPGCDPERRK